MNTESPMIRHRWFIIVSSLIVMMFISIYQYSWFLFAYALESQFRWNLSVIGLTFTVFAYTVTFIQPLSGFIADAYGPRKVSIIASLLVGAGFIFSSFAVSPVYLYFYYGMGGLGVGVLYGVSTACAVKWFREKRGSVTGLVVFGFGAGTAIFNWFIEKLLESRGLQSTFFVIGLAMIAILVPLSMLYKYPEEGESQETYQKEGHTISYSYKPSGMLKTYQWFLIYFSFIATVSIVLMFGAQMKMLAREFNIPENYFSLVLILFPLGNGLSRVFAGIVSDRIGRERTMVLFYSFLGLSILTLVLFAQVPWLFVILVFAAALLGGAPFALYPATVGDYYGPRYATTNYGITYTAKSWAGLISGWLSGYLVMEFGSYKTPLIIVALLSLIAAICSHPRFLSKPQATAERRS